MRFDLIIANPPYGKTGADITKNIIDTIEYDEFINLLPANDYKRNKEKNLFRYACDLEPISNGFTDAAVTTHLASIVKTPTEITLEQFEREQYTDPQLVRYFEENDNRNHYAIDTAITPLRITPAALAFSPETSFIIGIRDIGNGNMPYTKDCATYKWNVEKGLTINDIAVPHPEKKTANEFTHQFIKFNTAAEKDNFSQFVYSDLGFRFISKVFTAVNIDCSVKANRVFPKVDWTRTWTVEDLLLNYGYSATEVVGVLDNLSVFPGLKD